MHFSSTTPSVTTISSLDLSTITTDVPLAQTTHNQQSIISSSIKTSVETTTLTATTPIEIISTERSIEELGKTTKVKQNLMIVK